MQVNYEKFTGSISISQSVHLHLSAVCRRAFADGDLSKRWYLYLFAIFSIGAAPVPTISIVCCGFRDCRCFVMQL